MLVCNPSGCQSSLRWVYPEQIHLRMVYIEIVVQIISTTCFGDYVSKWGELAQIFSQT